LSLGILVDQILTLLSCSFCHRSIMDSIAYGIVVPGALGLLYSAKEAIYIGRLPLDGHPNDGMINKGDSAPDALEKMKELGGIISDGANCFLFAEYKYMAIYIVLFTPVVWLAAGLWAAVAFVVGSITSIVCGWIGMKIAVYTNYRTAHECWSDVTKGYDVAIRGGCVMGFTLVCIGLLNLYLLIRVFEKVGFESQKELYEAIAGYGLGGSSIALFGRVGGGIYTKAADVGADLSGKIEQGLDEDDPRNPACIADNVGDNVGDIAGMGADLFGSFAESTCAALVIASAAVGCNKENVCGIADDSHAMMFPLLITSTGIISGIITLLVVNFIYKVDKISEVEKALKGVLNISTVLETPFVYGAAVWCLPSQFLIGGLEATPLTCTIAVWLGLWSGLIIGYTTEYYTSFSYTPVQNIAKTQATSAATGIIYGLAVGYMSAVVPVCCLAVTILVGHTMLGMYGVALGALGMLSTLTMGLTIDAYGPISDNAGGIAEMSGLSMEVRKITDALDAAGNTTAAIGKGFAIGSAALVSLALFGAYTVRAEIQVVDVLDPWTFTGLLLGAMLPYAFSAMTMRSVGDAATDMVEECRLQFKAIMNEGAQPDYARCIRISTEASLREMIAPGALVILSPLIIGVGLGKNCLAGLLSGALVSGVQMAISMSNTGGAWDNAKKFIEKEGAKGTEQYKNAVTGDTVGDPLKDTSGPALNIVMKLTAIISLVFGTVISEYSNAEGGPFWL
jgi:inorganic pyrophosphatase